LSHTLRAMALIDVDTLMRALHAYEPAKRQSGLIASRCWMSTDGTYIILHPREKMIEKNACTAKMTFVVPKKGEARVGKQAGTRLAYHKKKKSKK
jgi:hypothetical protein